MQKNYEYFLAVAEETNFTRAAEKLYISQPALSKFIRRLEESLGVTLFDRAATPMKLTYAGELYQKYVEESIRREKVLMETLKEIQENERGEIRIGVPSFRGTFILPDILPLFHQKYPKVRVSLTEGFSSFLFNELMNENIQCCISNPTDTLNYTLLDSEFLYREEIYLAVSTNYLRLREFVADPEEVRRMNRNRQYPIFDIRGVADEQFFMTKPRQSMTHVVEQFLNAHKVHLTNVMRSTNLDTCINLAYSGMGLTFAPDISFRRDYFPKNLLYFRVAEENITWDHTAFFKKDAYISRHCRAFVEIMKEYYSK